MGSTPWSRLRRTCLSCTPRLNRSASPTIFSAIWRCCMISAPSTFSAYDKFSPLHMTAPLQTPLALVAELTHRCPLHCVYCSNPVELTSRAEELPTEIWTRVFEEAAQLGVLQA